MTAVFAQIWSDRAVINVGQFCAYNAAIGLGAFGLGLVSWIAPVSAPAEASALLLGLGLLLLAGLPFASAAPAAVSRVLFAHGLLITGTALFGSMWSIAYLLRPAATAHSFRYVPGLTLVLVSYGMLQVGLFGPWPQHSRKLRRFGFLLGLVNDLMLSAVLVWRLWGPASH
jgi:hypothetical protein